MIVVVVLILFLFLYLYHHFIHKRRNYPNGPIPLPFLGNALTLGKYHGDLDQIFIKWRKEFGDIYTVWLGETPIVMVNGYAKIIELFQHDDGRYAGRFSFDDKNDLMRGGKVAGILHTSNDLWLENRRFTLRVFRDFGLGKNVMEQRILNEVSELISTVNKDIENGVHEHNICEHVEARVGSVINSILFGYRFDQERMEEFRTIKRLMSDYVRLAGSLSFRIAQSNSSLFLHIPKIRRHVEETQANAKKLIQFFQNQIEEHEKNCDFETQEEPTSFVMAYLQKQKQHPDNQHFNTYQLIHVIYDLWLAGQETTSTVLSWLLIYLIEHPEIQKEMHNELDRVIGSDRLITTSDKSHLPYTCAVVNEGLRLANILAVNVLHKLLVETEIEGKLVPKNTCILPQICTVLYDSDVFKAPRTFDPERFLDQNGNLKTIDEFVPFGVGKRRCLGEGIANTELFLIPANFFNHFEVYCGSKKPDNTRLIGGTIHPKSPFLCEIKKRFN